MTRPDATTTASGDSGRAIERRAGGGRFVVSILLSGACLLSFACTQEPPRQVALRDEIAIGPYALEILRARHAPNPPPPISTFRSQPGKKGIVVFVYWKKLPDIDGMRRLAFIENFLDNQLWIADSNGKRTKAFDAMQEQLMFMQDPGSNWRDWIVVFYVPDDSRELTLLVENPEPRDGQARFTATPLGM
jgi:hypothetical protein